MKSMDKLKTLKDLNLGIYDSDVNCICGRQFKEHEWNFKNKKQPCKDSSCLDFTPIKKVLKDEAVKWVKHLENEKIRLKEDVDCVCDCDSRIEMIKHFFNLTSEDLNDE